MPPKNFARKVWPGNSPDFQGLPFSLACWLILVVLGSVPVPCRGQGAKPDVAPPSKWIVPIPFNPRVKLDDVDPSQEMRWVLKDRQINAGANESFHHEVRKLLTPSGVNNFSHISVDYDPSYQLLTFHWGTSSIMLIRSKGKILSSRAGSRAWWKRNRPIQLGERPHACFGRRPGDCMFKTMGRTPNTKRCARVT